MTIQELIDSGNYQLIDVREPMELIMDGEISSAINIPLGEIDCRADEIKAIEKPIIIFCKAGRRAESAIEVLSQKGIPSLYNGGGYCDLKELI